MHELRNPLAPIRNGLQIMRLANNAESKFDKPLSMMERQLGQMIRLVDDLLDMSRISRGKMTLQKERGPLAAVIDQAVETSRPLIEASSHALSISMPYDAIFVDADVTRLAQVVSNLLNNAAKYTNPGGQILLNVELQSDQAAIRVRDTGVGIPAPMLPKVFDLFTQVDRSLEKAQGGLGIGLTLVKRLVEMHGGTVEAHSEGQGRGSEFIVRVPVVESAELAKVEVKHTHLPGRFRILVTDDNVDSAESLSELLLIMGNDVRTAHDGRQALEVGELFRPDIVFLDIGMPKMNGYEACRRIREQSWGRNIVLIALTGWGQDEDKKKSQDAGFNHHLVKPVDPSDLSKLLTEVALP
ncbi:MAG: ATP-binding protein [Gemmatales bacterium]